MVVHKGGSRSQCTSYSYGAPGATTVSLAPSLSVRVFCRPTCKGELRKAFRHPGCIFGWRTEVAEGSGIGLKVAPNHTGVFGIEAVPSHFGGLNTPGMPFTE